MKMSMLVMVSMLELAAAMQGGTCDALPPLGSGTGSWEPIQQKTLTGVSTQACCQAAGAAAWTYYSSYPINNPKHPSKCLLATGDGSRKFVAGTHRSIMVPPAAAEEARGRGLYSMLVRRPKRFGTNLQLGHSLSWRAIGINVSTIVSPVQICTRM